MRDPCARYSEPRQSVIPSRKSRCPSTRNGFACALIEGHVGPHATADPPSFWTDANENSAAVDNPDRTRNVTATDTPSPPLTNREDAEL